MIRTRLLLVALGAALVPSLTPSVAIAEGGKSTSSGFYAEARAGVVFLENSDNDFNSSLGATTKFDEGYSVSLALGAKMSHFAPHWKLAKKFRIEAEVSYSQSEIENGLGDPEASAAAYMGNIYYDFDLHDRWSGFVGGGIGAALLSLEGNGLRDDNDTVFAYQVRAGVGYQLTPKMTATLGYRFFDTEDGEFSDGAARRFDAEYRSHGVEAGLRYAF